MWPPACCRMLMKPSLNFQDNYMPASFKKKLFCRWLKNNRHLFNVKPYIEKIRKNYFVVKFTGADSQISCIFTQCGQMEIWAKYKEDVELIDILAEFDLEEARTASGQYYCKSCLVTQYFGSREELWIEHSFKPLAGWVNENLTNLRMLCFFQMPSKSCWIELVPENKVEESRQKEYFVTAVPVVKRKTSIVR